MNPQASPPSADQPPVGVNPHGPPAARAQPPVCRLLAVDLDGTLLDSTHRVPPRNRQALHRAHEAGIKVVLCTGRSYFETKPVLDSLALDLDAAVTVFGAVLSDARTGRTLDRTCIPLDTARHVNDWLAGRGHSILWLLDREHAGLDAYYFEGQTGHPGCERWLRESGCRSRVFGGKRSTDSSCAEAGQALAEPLRITVVGEAAELRGLSGELEGQFAGRLVHNVLRAPGYDLTLIEAFAPQVNKWYGIEKLCRLWGIDPRHTAAVGDDVNDLELLRRAGVGIAMGNAGPRVREAARLVTCSHDECGVARVVDFLLDGAELHTAGPDVRAPGTPSPGGDPQQGAGRDIHQPDSRADAAGPESPLNAPGAPGPDSRIRRSGP